MTATRWEYCVLTRLSNGPDSKWYVNRMFDYSEPIMPIEVTADEFRKYNEEFDVLHASLVYPILPVVLNRLGADGWELLDDMNTGLTGGEGLVFRRPVEAPPATAKPKRGASAKTTAARKEPARRRK
jgi:hypothetical protein